MLLHLWGHKECNITAAAKKLLHFVSHHHFSAWWPVFHRALIWWRQWLPHCLKHINYIIHLIILADGTAISRHCIRLFIGFFYMFALSSSRSLLWRSSLSYGCLVPSADLHWCLELTLRTPSRVLHNIHQKDTSKHILACIKRRLLEMWHFIEADILASSFTSFSFVFLLSVPELFHPSCSLICLDFSYAQQAWHFFNRAALRLL